ncbi:Caspase-8 [Papilio machaon]|uniref:Caspase-8 n=1 Tax=Papilio machaon TaxID=76193 RepID=A0A194QL32_PAPMA|nr:Caspase-8 [Papilio machaon]
MNMLRSEAKTHLQDCFSDNIRTINLEMVSEIQNDIDYYDTVSLVFLLYDVPDTALQRLIVFQRVYKDTNMNLLYDWALNVHSRPTWRYEFLEALTICRLYHVIKKLGFDVASVKERYMPGNINVCVYINPIKKALYKFCENVTANNLVRLKKSLLTYEIDTSEHESCELICLELISQKFISLTQNNLAAKIKQCQVEKLVKIVENIPGLKKIAEDLQIIANKINNDSNFSSPQIMSTPISLSTAKAKLKEDKFDENFCDIFQRLNELQEEDIPVMHLKADTKNLTKDAYPIINTDRIGVCCIVNQEEFHPSKDSIENNFQTHMLDNRLGSTKDQQSLEHLMSSLNFKIKSCRNLNHRDMFKFIRDVINNDVRPEDSIFMLCILSHGIRGHVYAADSVKVKVEDIQKLLDSDDASNLHGKPKILILQACQVDEHRPMPHLVADGPTTNYFFRKSDFLIYWATAPEYEAYRDEQKGSIFIQILCYTIGKKARQEHLYEIFTKVTNSVSHICSRLQQIQVPIFESTLRKKLYLQLPQVSQ